MLLHKSLEESISKNPGDKLREALELVKQFPQALDVIVNCARKNEMTLWGQFFKVAGDPKDFFHTSLENGDLSCSTSYLIIIQSLESAEVSQALAMKLFEHAFAVDDFQTASELYRFLRSIDESEGMQGR